MAEAQEAAGLLMRLELPLFLFMFRFIGDSKERNQEQPRFRAWNVACRSKKTTLRAYAPKQIHIIYAGNYQDYVIFITVKQFYSAYYNKRLKNRSFSPKGFSFYIIHAIPYRIAKVYSYVN